jgi:cyanophycinase
MPVRRALLLFACLAGNASAAIAADFPTPTLADINPAGVSGALVICGGGNLPDDVIARFRDLAGGDQARLVVIPTAGDNADSADPAVTIALWKERGFADVTVLHTRSRETADSEEFAAPLTTATAAWFEGGAQSRIAEAYVGTCVERELYALLRRGSVIGGTSAGAAIQSRLMIARRNPDAELMQGLDLLPGAVIDQHFKARNRQPRLTAVLESHPGHIGLGIDEGTALIVRGRSLEVLGESTVTVCFAKSGNRPPRQYEIESGATGDLTALRRTAIARAQPPFPPAELRAPVVGHGALVLVGGGSLPDEVVGRFIKLAGGERSRIVVVPTAGEDPDFENPRDVQRFSLAGANDVTLLHTTDRYRANDEEFITPLKEATGVWFTGGRQWRLVDAYADTKTLAAIRDVLRRGGVIGGSSAGATIQGEYLVRGSPLGNTEMMAEGYEQGFAFLPGVAIDQHFTERNRQPEMEALKRTFPQLLGIGIDQSTALVVQGHTAEVIGEACVSFYGENAGDDGDTPGCIVLKAGESYDLKARRAAIGE